jgi:hypothetical protein
VWLGTHARLLANVVTVGARSLISGGGEATGVVGFEEKLVDVWVSVEYIEARALPRVSAVCVPPVTGTDVSDIRAAPVVFIVGDVCMLYCDV